MNCKSCNAPLKPEAKFCTKCGASQLASSIDNVVKNTEASNEEIQTPNNPKLSMAKQKIFWNIQPGEIARSIKEEEFLQYENAQGLIVNDGTTAYIKSNGKVIAEIHGGNYDFIPPKELEEFLEKRTNGIVGSLKKGWKWLVNAVMGSTIKDKITEPEKELEKLESLDLVLEHLKRGEIFAITLKQDREFQLIFGDLHKDLDEYANFTPLKIRTKTLDVQLGMRAFFHIKDFTTFSSFYLTDRNTVRTATLANLITPLVQSVLNECLHDLELTDNRIPENVCRKIEEKLKLNNFHGIELHNIIEISADNEDLNRFRELSRELYLSEKELDYLHRSNDFINRLNATNDEQSVHNKTRELDIYRRLEEINKDKLLAEDEFEKFYQVLTREKKIREAQDKNEFDNALAEIRKTGLLRDEEINILADKIKNGEEERGFALKLLQLTNAVQYEKTRLGSRQDIELQTVLHDINLTRQQDDYQDERFYKNRDQKRAEISDVHEDMEFMQKMAEQSRQSQLDAISRLQQLENEKEDKASQRRINETQQTIDATLAIDKEETERLRIRQTMSQEQIMAENIQGMDAEAQKEYAKSFSAGKNLDQEREQRERLEELLERQEKTAKEDKELIITALSNAMDKVVEAGKGTSKREEERAEEYKQMHRREQERHDRHQDIALNYTTRPQNVVSNVQGGQPAQPSPAAIPTNQTSSTHVAYSSSSKGGEGKVCKSCQTIYDSNERFCEKCGTEL